MGAVRVDSSSKEKPRHLAVFLPGLGDTPRTLIDQNFVAELRAAPQFDAIIADAHYGYYRKFTLLQRLHEDVISKVRKDYDEMWVIGISMGGYGATAYAERFPDQVTGVVLLAPYLGQKKILQDIETSGGLLQWNPSHFDAKSERTRHGVALWKWFRDRPSDPNRPVVIFATGSDDVHMRYLEVLRPALPRERVFLRPGGHDWPVWRPLFAQVVKKELKSR